MLKCFTKNNKTITFLIRNKNYKGLKRNFKSDIVGNLSPNSLAIAIHILVSRTVKLVQLVF